MDAKARPITIPSRSTRAISIHQPKNPFDLSSNGSPPSPFFSHAYSPSSRATTSFSQPSLSGGVTRVVSFSSRVPATVSKLPGPLPASRTSSNPMVSQTGFSDAAKVQAGFSVGPTVQTGFDLDPAIDDIPVRPGRMSFSNLSSACLATSELSASFLSPDLTPATTPSLSPDIFGLEHGFDLGESAVKYHCLGPVDEGVGGVYLVRHYATGQLRVFKPTQEEGYQHTGDSCAPLKRGVEYGEATLKEIAAYLLDHEHFAGVPATEMGFVTVDRVAQQGSLQDYVAHTASCEDHGNAHFTPKQVHAIGLLDLRLLNLDRHLGNILVTSEKKLVPIDHGYVLPSYEELGDVTFEWLYWRQCKEPFDEATKAYVAALDPHRDIAVLRDLGLTEGSIVAQFCASVLVKRAVEKGLTLFQIGNMVQRVDGTTPSPAEELLKATGAKAVGHFERDPAFYTELCAAVDGILPS